MTAFVALDFETADYPRDSACSLALARVEGGQVVERLHRLIRPPRPRFVFTELHGIAWRDVAGEPDFGGVWRDLGPALEGAAFIAAHNASFDASVLRACCAAAGLPAPATRFVCTMRLARTLWDIRPTRLPDVCHRLGIPFTNHHNALADAEACAGIVLAAMAQGARL